MITNNVFFDGITHRKMRESLLQSFAKVQILDLHGSAKKLEVAPDGGKDENVFDIQQGVGISVFVNGLAASSKSIKHFDLWKREQKYHILSGNDSEPLCIHRLQPTILFRSERFLRLDVV